MSAETEPTLTVEEIARENGLARVDVSHALVWLRIQPVRIIDADTLEIDAADVPKIITHVHKMRGRPSHAR